MNAYKKLLKARFIQAGLVLSLLPVTVLAQRIDISKIENELKNVSVHQLAAVVCIKMHKAEANSSQDALFSGVVVDTSGYILSSAHSMIPGQTYQIKFPDGRSFMAKGLGRILSNDAALLKITEKGIWPFSEMASSNAVKENQLCIGISYAGNLGQPKPNVRLGYVAEPSSQNGSFRSTCLMEPGDSGGPVYDLSGKVIGIHSRIELAPDRNFETPVTTYKKYWGALLNPQTYETLPQVASAEATQTDDKSSALPAFQKIREAVLKKELKFQRSVVKMVSNLDGRKSFALGTLVKFVGLGKKKPSATTNYLVSKGSIVGDQPLVLIGTKSVEARILRRDGVNDLILLEFDAKLENEALNLASTTNPSDHFGGFLLSTVPEKEAYLSILGYSSASIKIPPYPGFLRAAIELKDGAVTVKDTLSTNPFSLSMLKIGDKLLSVNNKEIKLPQDLVAETSKYRPGQEVKLVLMRDGKQMEVRVKLSWITDFVLHIADQFTDGKSKRRFGFEQVFVHDGQLKPSECGGPVFDSEGAFYGINIARFSRSSTLAVPASVVAKFVEDGLRF